MIKDKVSIIIPSYNVKAYIDECLDSIESQTYENIEIVIIDDGSDDGTLTIIYQRAKSTRRIYKIISQKNSGQSVARNRGLEEATGKYVIFVDSDDWITAEDAVEKMVYKIQSESADFVQCSLEFVKNNRHSLYTVPQKSSIIGEQPLIDMLKVKDLYTSPWAKIYSAEFLRKYNIRFINGLVNEDTAFSIIIAAKAQKVAFLSDVVYSSRERDGSTSRTSFIRMFKTMHEVMNITRNELIQNSRYSNEIRNLLESRYIRSMLYNLMQTAQRSDYKRYVEDREYCFSNTDYESKFKYVRYLPLAHRVIAYMSRNKLLFFGFAKVLRNIGFKMH